MGKLKTFFYSFKRSLSDITYYRDVIKAPFSFSFKYLYFLIYVIIFVQGVVLSITLATIIPKMPAYIAQFKNRVMDAYPKELVVTVKDGMVSTNVKEPYRIDIPELAERDSEFKHLITIDTQATVDDYKKYESVVLVTKKAVVYPDRQRNDVLSYKVNYVEEYKKNFVVNQSLYQKAVARFLPYLDYLPNLAIVLAIVGPIIGPFIFGTLVYAWKLVYLLLMTMIIWLVSMLFKTKLGYWKLYQLGLHALTVPIVLSFLLGLFSVDIPNLYTLSFLLWMAVILAKLSPGQAVVDTKKAV